MAFENLRRENGTAPTDEQIAEYEHVYRAVSDAARSGYHLPYGNIHDDGDLWAAYDLAFNDAVRAVPA